MKCYDLKIDNEMVRHYSIRKRDDGWFHTCFDGVSEALVVSEEEARRVIFNDIRSMGIDCGYITEEDMYEEET